MFTNIKSTFFSTCVLQTCLSDFHLMTLTVMRKSYKEFQSRIVSYRSYKNFSNKNFGENLLHSLLKANELDCFQKFFDIGFETLIQMLFFNKLLSKAIMTSLANYQALVIKLKKD